jgi:hypothetical protein
MTRTLLLCALLLLLTAAGANAKNVDLVTLPDREGVELTIYNSDDITLVKERRHVTFTRGANRLLFSWANTLIDPTSVEIRPLEHVDAIEVADTVYPGQKPQFLMWNIESEYEGQVLVEVSYFTSGLTWTMDYVGTTDPDEETMDFRGYVRVFNQSGEAYERARIRLIVGTINLVEKIADLARRRGIPPPAPQSPMALQLRRDSAKEAFGRAEAAQHMDLVTEAKGVVKEGLSEYFMFTIEGTETVQDGWSKRMEAVQAPNVAFDVVYRMRAHQYGPRPVRFFVWKNDEEHELGGSPLPDGRVRLFRANGEDGLSFLGEQQVRYVPVQAPIEVDLGPDDLVVYASRQAATKRYGFTFHPQGHVTGWTEETDWTDEIRNYRTKPIRFELRRQWPGHVEYESELPTALFDYQTIETMLDVGPRDRAHYPATVVTHRGANGGQERISLR